MPERKLASIQTVSKLTPIQNSDNLELAEVLGWKCVVKKGEFNEGDRAVYFEIDSVLPKDKEWAAFMEKYNHRVRTIKLRGQLSQGLLLPISILEGVDVTELLGVTKYEGLDRVSTYSNARGNFPSEIPKTDEPRIQSNTYLLDEMWGQAYYATLKLDGTSATYCLNRGGEFHACSRNYSVKDENNSLWWKVARKYKIEEIFRAYDGMQFAIQGEIVGPGIQGNPLALTDVEFYVFQIYAWGLGAYWEWWEVTEFCREHGLKWVPTVLAGDSFNYTLDEVLYLAKGNYDGTDHPREGLVFRPQEERITSKGERLSFKVINSDYLLKKGE